MKKIISLVLTFMMITSISVVSFAQENVSDLTQVNSQSINEYDMLKSLSTFSGNNLMARGYNSEQIKVINNYHEEYVKHVKNLNKLDDSTLKDFGYTDNQIQLINNYDESVQQTRAVASTLNLHVYATNLRYNSSNDWTTAKAKYNWKWTGVPIVKIEDAVGIAWNDWIVTDQGSSVTYKHIYGTESDFYREAVYTTNKLETNGAGHEFDMSKRDNYYWAKEGSGWFKLKSDASGRKNLYIYGEYGHLTFGFGIALSYPGGLHLDFHGGTISIADHDKDRAEF